VFAAMRDKDVAGMFAALLPAVERLIITRASNARSADPESLARQARAIAPALPIAIVPELGAALDTAWRASPRIIVAGSIFLLGDALKIDRRDVIRFEDLRARVRMLTSFDRFSSPGVRVGSGSRGVCAGAGQADQRDHDQRQPRRSNNQKDWHFDRARRNGSRQRYQDLRGGCRRYTDTHVAIATGNVVFAQGDDRISAEHAEFDTETRLGTFYNASGFSKIKPPVSAASRAGAIAPPPVVGQDTVVMFFGEKIEKIGPKKYRITNGGFSTCVQPTPRWDLHAGTVILNVDHYTVLKNAVLRVKGVPMFYTPILYYPTKRDGRATGFLMPTYGSSSLRGQSFHNGFFWAINRSQDATILHDWFSKTGQGLGSEYRYNAGSGDGNISATSTTTTGRPTRPPTAP
jgi:hypothetical protein